MNLPFKDYLLKKINQYGVKMYENEIYRYASDLGVTSGNIADCFLAINRADPKEYCGEGLDDRAKYYLLDDYDNYYWFASAKDAIVFADPNTKSVVGTFIDITDIFHQYHRQYNNGFYFLYPEDLDNIDEIKANKPKLVCLDRDVQFQSEDEAAIWLVNSGFAANVNTAKRQLEKHLNGQTATCYKLRFQKL